MTLEELYRSLDHLPLDCQVYVSPDGLVVMSPNGLVEWRLIRNSTPAIRLQNS